MHVSDKTSCTPKANQSASLRLPEAVAITKCRPAQKCMAAAVHSDLLLPPARRARSFVGDVHSDLPSAKQIEVPRSDPQIRGTQSKLFYYDLITPQNSIFKSKNETSLYFIGFLHFLRVRKTARLLVLYLFPLFYWMLIFFFAKKSDIQ